MNKTPYSHKRLPRLTANGQKSFTLNDWVNDHAVQSKGRWNDLREAYRFYTRIGGIDYESPWIHIRDNRVSMEHVLIDDVKITGEFPLKGWGEYYLREISLRLMANKYGLTHKQFTLTREQVITLITTGSVTATREGSVYTYQHVPGRLADATTGELVYVTPEDGYLDHYCLIKPTGIVEYGLDDHGRFAKSTELAIPFTF